MYACDLQTIFVTVYNVGCSSIIALFRVWSVSLRTCLSLRRIPFRTSTAMVKFTSVSMFGIHKINYEFSIPFRLTDSNHASLSDEILCVSDKIPFCRALN